MGCLVVSFQLLATKIRIILEINVLFAEKKEKIERGINMEGILQDPK